MITLTQEQMNDLVFQVTEKVLLRMPEVLGNLMQEHVSIHATIKDFYKKYPHFVDNKLIVQKAVAQLESENPTVEYHELLEQAVPIIENNLKVTNQCDLKKKKKLEDLNLTTNGIL